MTTTLVLTRKPDAVFQSSLFKTQFGRFGTLLVLQGPPVTKVEISEGNGDSDTISVPTGNLAVSTTDGTGVEEIGRYTTIERMHGYIQLKPQHHNGKVYKEEPYGLRYEPHNRVVAELKSSGGRCFRVLGGLTEKERAILIHEAPHVGFLVGCIGPRMLNDCDTGFTSSSHAAMNELFRVTPRPSALFVLDW